MAHSVQLTEFAYQTYARKAKDLGMSLEEYLDRSARVVPAPDGFVLTPEVESAIRQALADVAAGRTSTLSEVRERLALYSAKWQEEKRGP